MEKNGAKGAGDFEQIISNGFLPSVGAKGSVGEPSEQNRAKRKNWKRMARATDNSENSVSGTYLSKRKDTDNLQVGGKDKRSRLALADCTNLFCIGGGCRATPSNAMSCIS